MEMRANPEVAYLLMSFLDPSSTAREMQEEQKALGGM